MKHKTSMRNQVTITWPTLIDMIHEKGMEIPNEDAKMTLTYESQKPVLTIVWYEEPDEIKEPSEKLTIKETIYKLCSATGAKEHLDPIQCLLHISKEYGKLQKELKESQLKESPSTLVTVGECLEALKQYDKPGEPNTLIALIHKVVEQNNELRDLIPHQKGCDLRDIGSVPFEGKRRAAYLKLKCTCIKAINYKINS